MSSERLAVFELLINPTTLKSLEQLTLSLPEQIVCQLMASSEKMAIDIHAEIISRLMLTVINPKIFGLNPQVDKQAGRLFLKAVEKSRAKEMQ